MKKSIKLLSVLFLGISLFSASTNAASAQDSSDPALKQQYQDYVNQGAIDSSSISYDDWVESYLSSKEIEASFPNVSAASSKKGQVVSPAYTEMKPGDIFVTNDAEYNGLVGHTAIAISSTAILQMTGPNKPSDILSYGEFKKKYNKSGKHIWIYRHANASVGQKAADWARRHYWNYNGGSQQTLLPHYKINNNLYSTDPSYCSKLVWQAYYNTSPSYIRPPLFKIVAPYTLMPSRSNLWNVEPKLVATVTNYSN
ncbi:hypothetical protein Q9R38_27635 [Priestia aryabhattai]|uniref:hypothetical protein n=1 Tax=Priestia aryabhattai TaxID=412384 RepID=UPI0028810FAE|nr:hypothetical protein [Priestia aryabhattai]MDT0150296.1 hypothetical protein [Priestia aryabhattai]MDT0155885.1 hypothetical protein [Priestia aryabhattai]